MDSTIINKLNEAGIDYKRLKAVLDSGDNWGSLVHAFEALTVLGVVCDAMRTRESAKAMLD